jgi:hypothetical protein
MLRLSDLIKIETEDVRQVSLRSSLLLIQNILTEITE